MKFFLFFFCLFYNFLISQVVESNKRFVSIGINGGIFGWSPSQTKIINGYNSIPRTLNAGPSSVYSNDGTKHVELIANTSIGINIGYARKVRNNFYYFSLEFQQNKASYQFTMPLSFVYKNITFKELIEKDIYNYSSVSFQYNWLNKNSNFYKGELYTFLKLSIGVTTNHKNFDYSIKEGFEQDWTENGIGFKTKIISANPLSWMISPEIGKRLLYFKNCSSIDLGLVYHYPFVNTFVQEYEFFSQGNSLGKSQITFKGSSIHLNIRYIFNFEKN